MKTQETIGLNLVATVSVGLLTSLLLLFCAGSNKVPTFIAVVPLALSALAAFIQYKFVMTPWQSNLAELVSKAQTLQEAASTPPPVPA